MNGQVRKKGIQKGIQKEIQKEIQKGIILHYLLNPCLHFDTTTPYISANLWLFRKEVVPQ